MDLLSVRLHDGGGGRGGGGGGGGSGGGAVVAADEFRVRNSIYTWLKFTTSAEL